MGAGGGAGCVGALGQGSSDLCILACSCVVSVVSSFVLKTKKGKRIRRCSDTKAKFGRVLGIEVIDSLVSILCV